MKPSNLLIIGVLLSSPIDRAVAQHGQEHKPETSGEEAPFVVVGKLVDAAWFVIPREVREGEDQTTRATNRMAAGNPAAEGVHPLGKGRSASEEVPGTGRKADRVQFNCAKCPGYCCSYPVIVVTKRDLERKESLLAKGFISAAERDKAVFVERGAAEAVRTAESQLRAAEALIANARAVVKQREAALASARNDLSKTEITAPVDGVVISRQVEPGQTVAASLNTPTLFTIAQDLREMQVDVAIDESDIGRIRVDQRAAYTVDAYPGRTFEGTVRQIRKAAQTVQNVVTYIVVVGTRNPSLQLVPGMTANVRIVTDQRDGVLKVPNAALRWRPAGVASAPLDAPPGPGAGNGGPGGGDMQARRQRLIDELKLDAGQVARLDEILAEQRARFASLRELPESERRPRAERIRAEVRQRIGGILDDEQQRLYAAIVATETGRGTGVAGSGRVFVPTAAGPSEVRVRTGLTDGNATEVVGRELAEGQEVIVGTQQPAGTAPRASSAPRLPF